MAKHTPGPWRAEEREVVTYLGHPIAEVLDTAEGLEGSDAEADANARLIAAAPDLVAALEMILAGVDSGQLMQQSIDQARAAVVKAKGA